MFVANATTPTPTPHQHQPNNTAVFTGARARARGRGGGAADAACMPHVRSADGDVFSNGPDQMRQRVRQQLPGLCKNNRKIHTQHTRAHAHAHTSVYAGTETASKTNPSCCSFPEEERARAAKISKYGGAREAR